VQQVDTPLSIYHHPANRFVAGFIGSPTMNFFTGTVSKNGAWTFRQSGTEFRLPVAPAQGEKFPPTANVTLGIRPEHIYAFPPSGITTLSPFTAHVDVIEPVGNEIFVYFSTGADTHYVARIASDRSPEVGKSHQLLVDTSKMHFFDTGSELSL
jgi:multiple sugar transport system ATP-binding protein